MDTLSLSDVTLRACMLSSILLRLPARPRAHSASPVCQNRAVVCDSPPQARMPMPRVLPTARPALPAHTSLYITHAMCFPLTDDGRTTAQSAARRAMQVRILLSLIIESLIASGYYCPTPTQQLPCGPGCQAFMFVCSCLSPPGTVSNNSASVCSDCPPGTYQPVLPHPLLCVCFITPCRAPSSPYVRRAMQVSHSLVSHRICLCWSGYACATPTQETACVPGTYSQGGAASCSNCDAGSYQPVRTSPMCQFASVTIILIAAVGAGVLPSVHSRCRALSSACAF